MLPLLLLLVLLLLQVDRCVSLLMESGRLPEAALFARSYIPSRMKEPIEVREGRKEGQGGRTQ